MRRQEQILVVVGLVMIFAMTIYPPWQHFWYRGEDAGKVAPAGYGWLWSPPEDAHRIDYGRLALQIFCVLLIVLALVVSSRFSFFSSSAKRPTMNQDNWKQNLRGFGRMKLAHMEKHQPKLLAQLKSQGQLQNHVEAAQKAAEDYTEKAEDGGVDHLAAMEVAKETWIILPDLDDEEF